MSINWIQVRIQIQIQKGLIFIVHIMATQTHPETFQSISTKKKRNKKELHNIKNCIP